MGKPLQRELLNFGKHVGDMCPANREASINHAMHGTKCYDGVIILYPRKDKRFFESDDNILKYWSAVAK